jgi:ribose-phosphate pyrophosphokinase
MLIFSGSSNKLLAQKIAHSLGKKVSPVEIFVFPDGEKRITIAEKVLGETAVLIQSTNTPTDANYMELFLMVDALKRSGAEFVKLVMPYMGYQRQDHIFRDGEGVSLEVMAKILQVVGVSEVFSFDLHSIKIPEIFTIPTHNLSALSVFAKKIKEGFSGKEPILVSPDMGGIRRIKEISEMLNIPYVTIVKDRDLNTGSIFDSQLNGDVNDRQAIIVDDMIATGDTMVYAADLLLKNGATNVFAFATHPILAGKANKVLQDSRIEKVFATDTIEIPEDKKFAKLEILSIAEIAAKALGMTSY